jgi:hypothetical protein
MQNLNFIQAVTLDTPIESVLIQWYENGVLFEVNPPSRWVIDQLCDIAERTPPEFFAYPELIPSLTETYFLQLLNRITQDDEFGAQIEAAELYEPIAA